MATFCRKIRQSGRVSSSRVQVVSRLSRQALFAEIYFSPSAKRLWQWPDAKNLRSAGAGRTVQKLSGHRTAVTPAPAHPSEDCSGPTKGLPPALVGVWGLAVLVVGLITSATAGERLALVVNRNSWASRSVANYFASLRQVPSQHIILLDYRDSVERITLDQFQQQNLAARIPRDSAAGAGTTDRFHHLLVGFPLRDRFLSP